MSIDNSISVPLHRISLENRGWRVIEKPVLGGDYYNQKIVGWRVEVTKGDRSFVCLGPTLLKAFEDAHTLVAQEPDQDPVKGYHAALRREDELKRELARLREENVRLAAKLAAIERFFRETFGYSVRDTQ